MSTQRLTRFVCAVSAVTLLGACADQATAPTPVRIAPNAPSLSLTNAPNLGDWKSFQGEIWICKDGYRTGTPFAFDWSVVTIHGGTPVASGTAIVPVGSCVLAHHLDIDGDVRAHIAVTEQAPPANWALTAIVADHGNLPGTPEVPVVDLTTRSIAEVHANNDVGVQITFFNNYTCTYTQGFWKTHQELWDTNGEMVVWNGQTFFNSGKTYAQIFAMSAAGGNSYVKLGYQYMAAKLNVNFGADPTIAGAIAQAESFFNAHPAGSYSIKDAAWNAVAGTLDDYNNGITGPGHCGS